MKKFCQIDDILEMDCEVWNELFLATWLRGAPPWSKGRQSTEPEADSSSFKYYMKCIDIYKSSTTLYKFTPIISDFDTMKKSYHDRRIIKRVNLKRPELESIKENIRKIQKEEEAVLVLLGVI